MSGPLNRMNVEKYHSGNRESNNMYRHRERVSSGQDVFVPWVLSSENARTRVPRAVQTQIGQMQNGATITCSQKMNFAG